jgi:hypothetical protein
VRFDTTTAATSPASNASMGYNYRMEPQDIVPYLGKDMTISFYARSNARIAINSGYVGGTTASSIYLIDPNDSSTWVTLTSDWKRYKFTFTLGTQVPSTHLDIGIRHQPGIVGNVDMTGVQLEAGRNATDFEHRSYGEELALCQRYYQKMYFTVSDYPFGYCYTYNQGDSACSVPLATPMRTSSPNITFSTLRIRGYNQDGTNGSQAITSASGQTQNSHALLQLNLGHTNVPSAAVGSASVLTNGVSNSTSYLAVDAEL